MAKDRKVLISSVSCLLDFSLPVASRGNAGMASGCTLPPSVSATAGAGLALGLECPSSPTQQPEILMCHPPCTGEELMVVLVAMDLITYEMLLQVELEDYDFIQGILCCL